MAPKGICARKGKGSHSIESVFARRLAANVPVLALGVGADDEEVFARLYAAMACAGWQHERVARFDLISRPPGPPIVSVAEPAATPSASCAVE